MRIKYLLILLVCFSEVLFSQITAPSASSSFTTNYSAGFLGSGGANDLVYIFCGNQNESNVGELTLNAPTCTVSWYQYDGISFIDMGVTGPTASNLTSGLYMARKNCSGTITCYRAWVWVNQMFIDVNPITPGCETFTLSGQAQQLDNSFDINDPPGSDFIVDANTYIKVCFWANHTYVSDIGFYLKSPGFQAANPGELGVVQLSPAVSDWGPSASQGSWTGIPWSTLGCSSDADENTVCNAGDNVGLGSTGFCFMSHASPGGPALPAGTPALTPCVCDLPTPLKGNFASVGSWTTIYGSHAAEPGWSVQIYDCKNADSGALTRATITISGQTDCGQATFTYDSGAINSIINDNSCNAATASIYVVPPGVPTGSYSLTSSITSTEWTSIPAGFTSSQLSNTLVAGTPQFPIESTEYILTVVETINAPGNPFCTAVSSETIITLPANATITQLNPMCSNDAPVQLVAASGGGVWATTAPAGSLLNGYFYPGVAGPGTYTISYTIDGECDDYDDITVVVFDNIEVTNFSDDVCSTTNTEYYVTFNVVNSNNEFVNFYVNTGTGDIPYPGGYFAGTFGTNTIYNITVTDAHNCSIFEFNGSTNCICTTDAGNMTSLSPLILCQNQCTDMVAHIGNQGIDGDDIFEFAIHNGAYPATIYAYDSSPEFCFADIPNGVYGQTYYISSICGNPGTNGHVDQEEQCYSQSIGTPIVWFENPSANIITADFSSCGLGVTLVAQVPTASMTGSWSSNSPFVAVGGTTINNPVINVLASNYGEAIFTWTIQNGICQGSDQVTVYFNQTPVANAGEDQTVCGNEAELHAVLNLTGSIGQWSGPGSFASAFNPETTVNSSVGVQVFTWRESFGGCWDEDYVNITFVNMPAPFAISSIDTVCANTCNLSLINSLYPGYWTAYTGDPLTIMSPAPAYSPSINSPNATALIGSYTGLNKAVTFIWTETNEINGIPCTAEATKNVVFAKTPQASVGASNQREICGNCITFNASTVGISEYEHFWISKVGGNWTNPEGATAPNATYCVNVPVSFGDTAYVETEFLWAVKNGGCAVFDTMYVTFYQQPNANAGLNKAVCGNENDMNAIWNLSPNTGYTPSGIWSVGTHPNGESATFANTSANNSHVTVSEVGIWEFIFTEQNSRFTGCYDTDTVQIEFVEVPVISAGPDKDVCGNCTTMDGMTGGFGGSWLPNGGDFIDFSDPHSNVCVAAYVPTTFTWLESNAATTQVLSCTSTDDVIITFWRVPTANILTPPSDSTVCGLTFYNLRAESSGTGITGYWYNINPATVYGNAFSNNTWAKVPSYGYHNFYWIEQTGPGLTPGFCNDTAGPLRIRFIQIPTANAGGDTLFCGRSGYLNAIPSLGTGVWTTPSTSLILIENQNDPTSYIESEITNTGNPSYPYFTLIWTEDNSNGCTDKDTIQVVFARIPTAEMDIISPKCFGEPATIAASEDTLQQYSWSFNTGVVDHFTTNSSGGRWENFVYWNSTDTAHRVSLIATNHWGCQSPIRVDTVYEPIIPTFDIKIIMDTCALGKGGIVFGDTLGTSAFFWVDPNVGPAPETPITTVYNLPAGEYGINTSYLTPNIVNYAYYLQTFGTANCVDTFYYEIDLIGMIDAEISVLASVLLTELVAPDAVVTFLNTSDYDDVSKRCEWHFGDGSILKTCDELVEHTYTKANCYEPFLIVMNRNLPECRDTARLETCIFVDDASKLEVPNVFSPNGDGINDFFQVKARTLRTFTGTITNRWGRTVYEWSDWETYEAGWDGTIGGGSKAAPGVYFYIITAEGLDGTPYNPKGALHLLSE